MTNSITTSSEPWSEPVREVNPTPAARVILGAISLYQRLTSGRISPCRFYPSCSHYAFEAVEIHGALRGTGLALRRLGRCRPLGPHGVDLVPESKKPRSAHP
jgi:putative membrane protein insertion efficiency factor